MHQRSPKAADLQSAAIASMRHPGIMHLPYGKVRILLRDSQVMILSFLSGTGPFFCGYYYSMAEGARKETGSIKSSISVVTPAYHVPGLRSEGACFFGGRSASPSRRGTRRGPPPDALPTTWCGMWNPNTHEKMPAGRGIACRHFDQKNGFRAVYFGA